MYQPGNLPSDLPSLVEALRLELTRIAVTFSQPGDYAALKTLYAAPNKIFEGQIVKADGVSWDPGSGAGIYARVGGAWVKL